jgi:ATP-dependent Clp protease adaptor protein ClpS
MSDIITKPNIKDEIKVERPPLHKVILVNDDYMPREFVVTVLRLNSVRAKIKLCL